MCGQSKITMCKGNLSQSTDAERLEHQFTLHVTAFNRCDEIRLGHVVLLCGELDMCGGVGSKDINICTAQRGFGGFVDELPRKVVIPLLARYNTFEDGVPVDIVWILFGH